MWCKKPHFTNHNITLIHKMKKSNANGTKTESVQFSISNRYIILLISTKDQMSARPVLQLSVEPGKHLNLKMVYSDDSLQLKKLQTMFFLVMQIQKIPNQRSKTRK